ncbi:hypothetical protein Ct9H90mP29_02110 [bacterium]|nr:MAG: hypothetical protein Ct9H90mP29_02110 [bacterium]
MFMNCIAKDLRAKALGPCNGYGFDLSHNALIDINVVANGM